MIKISLIKKLLKKSTKKKNLEKVITTNPKNLDFGVQARKKLLKSSLLVNKAAKSTLGPLGRNCLIEYELGVPRITKDGVTVIKNLKTNNSVKNIGINLFKNISHNANKYCGDNTTSSTIIGTEIFNEGVKFLQAGGNPVIMKKGIEKAKNVVIEYLEHIKEDIFYRNKEDDFFDKDNDCGFDGVLGNYNGANFENNFDGELKNDINGGVEDNIEGLNKENNKINLKEKKEIKTEQKNEKVNNIIIENENEIFNEKNRDLLKKIALIATNFNENISNLLVEYFCELGPQGVHMLEISGVLENQMLFLEGGHFLRGYANNGFLKDKEKNGEELIMKNPFVLILDFEINDLNFIMEIIERVKKLNRPLLILCKEMKNNLISQLVFNVQKKVFDLCVIEFQSFAETNFLIEDLSVIFNSFIFDEFTVKSGFREFELSDLGEAKEIKLNEYETNFITSEKKTKEHKKKLKLQLEKIQQELEGGKLISFR